MCTMSFFKRLSCWQLAVLGAVGCLLVGSTPAFASGYWYGFKRFWTDYIAQTDGAILTAIVVGLISLFIITRGKWAK